jgi:hypothetical protein
MDQLDLNIDNYNLEDILKLFNLEYDFDKEGLKNAKKVVLMTHPDKSGLSKEYFLFFTAAYKLVYKIYEFRYKSENKKTEYTVEKNENNEELLKKIKHNENFNVWFNKMFDDVAKIRNDDQNTGYGDWFKSNEDLEQRTATKDNMNILIEQKKREIRSLVVHNGIREMPTQSNLYDLTMERPDSYSSDLFSKLQYDDLKKAHTETVVPVTIDDYNNRKKYNSADELKNARSIEDTTPLSLNQAKQYLSSRKELEDKNDIERAYKLAKQEEEAKKINNNWWSKLKQLTN